MAEFSGFGGDSKSRRNSIHVVRSTLTTSEEREHLQKLVTFMDKPRVKHLGKNEVSCQYF